jgi:hypothetical protein
VSRLSPEGTWSPRRGLGEVAERLPFLESRSDYSPRRDSFPVGVLPRLSVAFKLEAVDLISGVVGS